jgi:hypothetical protein
MLKINDFFSQERLAAFKGLTWLGLAHQGYPSISRLESLDISARSYLPFNGV